MFPVKLSSVMLGGKFWILRILLLLRLRICKFSKLINSSSSDYMLFLWAKKVLKNLYRYSVEQMSLLRPSFLIIWLSSSASSDLQAFYCQSVLGLLLTISRAPSHLDWACRHRSQLSAPGLRLSSISLRSSLASSGMTASIRKCAWYRLPSWWNARMSLRRTRNAPVQR